MGASLLSICYRRHSTAASASSASARRARRGRMSPMMRIVCAAAAVLVLAVAPAVAQEQRASIEGTIRDSSGGVLPGVTVEARSPSLAGVESTVSDAAGHVPVSGASARPLRSDGDAAGISAGEGSGRAPGARPDPQNRSRDAGRRAGRDRQGDRRVAAHRRQAELGRRERPGGNDRAHSRRDAISPTWSRLLPGSRARRGTAASRSTARAARTTAS